jgi:undecaprenyl pyrophosphate phosphatase UppP
MARGEKAGRVDAATYLIVFGAALAIPAIIYGLIFDRSAFEWVVPLVGIATVSIVVGCLLHASRRSATR